MYMQKTNYKNEQLDVEINCYINKKNEIWFRGKEIALTLGYKDTKKAIQRHVLEEDKISIDFKTHAKSHNPSGGETPPQAETPKNNEI